MILLILGILFIISSILLAKTNSRFELWLATTLATGLFFCLALIFLPISYFTIKSEIQEYKTFVKLVENARPRNNKYEMITVQLKIIDMDTWLANRQYWNNTIFDIYIPDEIMQLKPIELY